MTDISKISEKKFGDWTVNYFFRKEYLKKGHLTRLYCNCTCVCGKTKDVRADGLFDGTSRNCGCARQKNFNRLSHGLSDKRIYNIWVGIKQRCNNPKAKSYERYGGRGIKVCKEWEESFTNFYKWAIKNGYKDNLTIERIDIDKGYEPQNCKWITLQDQLKNTSRTVLITYRGVTKCATDWCRELGLNRNAVIKKFKRGLPIQEVLSK